MKNVLGHLEKKLFDIEQIIIVKEQSKLSLEIIRNNNQEIIRNIQRIRNVTIEALNTAIFVARSLYNQKLVLNKIHVLENDTGNLIKGTGSALKSQGVSILQDASNDNAVETLKSAFANVFNTINTINEQNKEAFPQNETQIIELKKTGDIYE